MRVFWILVRDTFLCVWSNAVEVYTTSRTSKSWRERILLFITCVTFSFVLSSFLLLYLLYTVDYRLVVAAGIACSFWVLCTAGLCLSRRARCFGVLFVISCGMKQSRNLLITAGTSLVVLRNFRNTLDNLAGLAGSMVCNLKAKRQFLDISPLDNYIRMLKWVGSILQLGLPTLGVHLQFDLDVTGRVDSDELREKLLQMERALRDTEESVRAVMDAVTSAGQRLFPAFSLILLAVFTALHLQRYRKNRKYKNRFLTSRFLRFDEEQKARGKAWVLPLVPEEEGRYATISSRHLTAREGKAMLKFSVPVFTHVLAWALFIGVDTLLYLFVKVIRNHLETLEPLHVPLIVNIKEATSVMGIPISEDSEQGDFSYSMALFEKRCLPEPELLLSTSLPPLAVVLAALLLMGLAAARLVRLRLLVCEHFFTEQAEVRVEHLHARILRKRSKGKDVDPGPGTQRALLTRLDFWCPLLFGQKEDTDPLRPGS